MDSNLREDGESWSWKVTYTSGSVPTARHCHSCTVYKNSMYLFGGYSNDNTRQGSYRNDTHAFNFDTCEWSHLQCQSPPSSRHSHSAVQHGQLMYVFGGISEGNALNDVWTLDVETRVWKELVCHGESPPPRWGHSSVVTSDGKSMVIFGGYGSHFFNNMYKLDFETSNWTKFRYFGQPPPPRQFHSAVVHNEYIFILGGFAGTTNHKDCYQFNLDTHTWSQCEPPPVPLRGHTAVMHKGSMYIFGGFAKVQHREIFEYTVGEIGWRVIDCDNDRHLPPVRHFHSAVIYENSMYIFGGYSSKSNLNDLQRYCFESKIPTARTVGIADYLQQLVNNPKFSDVTFRVEGKEVYAHKNILCIRSEHFRALIDGGMKESLQEVIELSVPYNVFLKVLEYIYTDRISIFGIEDCAVELLVVSDQFLLPGLKVLVEKILVQGISSSNIASLEELANQVEAPLLKAKCASFRASSKKFEASVQT